MFKIAMIGFGTVGTGVYNILEKEKEKMEKNVGQSIEIGKVMIQNPEKERSAPSEIFTTEFKDLLDYEPDLLIELTAEEELAFEMISKAMEKGVHIVTANKAVVSSYFEDLLQLAEEHQVKFLYESSVGGCIPILKTIKEERIFNDITEVSGILNGTCNFILSSMMAEKADYDDVLKEAQDLGFAEADPTADVSGLDSLRKLRILLSLAFQGKVLEEDILLEGIEKIKLKDINHLLEKEKEVKLVGLGKKLEDSDDKYMAIVEPCIVEKDHLLASVHYELNGMSYKGEYLNEGFVIGSGAGMYATADAVWRDVLDILLKNDDLNTTNIREDLINKNKNYKDKYYVRLKDLDGVKLNILDQKEKEGEFFLTVEDEREKIVQAVEEKSGFFARILD